MGSGHGPPDKWDPGQMGTGTNVPRTNGPRTNVPEDKWAPGQIGGVQLAEQISSEQVSAKDVMKTGGGRVVSASGSETSVSSSMPTSAIVYDAYTSIIKKKNKKKKKKKKDHGHILYLKYLQSRKFVIYLL